MSINRVARNQNFTYFAVGFSVISLTIDKLILEIRLDSMQKTQLRLTWSIIFCRSPLLQIVSAENNSDNDTQHVGIET